MMAARRQDLLLLTVFCSAHLLVAQVIPAGPAIDAKVDLMTTFELQILERESCFNGQTKTINQQRA
jgi:hypothetical protein